ncbi:polyprenyl diphosphate synthase [Stenoxybacter acetivorans]|uniref:polyprenyl diphosphate synthase n=1 Tax=Stenoxybacter acetivorans TaxID=422441 RepID=UPI00056CAF42|nr:polyprenyl diphosphate synthase [Stenoxybacter acetivorans]
MTSSTQTIPKHNEVPRHLAVIMDGNGRWAKKRMMPRVFGHKKGLETLERLTIACARMGVEYLTVFAFSTENWRRPADEVGFLMNLFLQSLQRHVQRLHENGLRLKVIGERTRFSPPIINGIEAAERLTAANTGLTLTIAADYGGRWDILQAANQALSQGASRLDEETLRPYLSLGDAPEPDLFIRTGGETRISNFLLWQLAYTELYFTDTLWPDFDDKALALAVQSYRQRERRFGRTTEQLPTAQQRD